MKPGKRWNSLVWLAGSHLLIPGLAGEARFAVWQCAEVPEGALACRRIVMEAPAASVYSVDLVLSYSPAESVVGTIAKGGLAGGMSLARNSGTPGLIRIGLASGTPVGGTGDLLEIPFADTSDVLLRIESVLVNEGGVTAGFADNTPPALAAVGDLALAHGDTLSRSLSVSDSDLPAQPLVFGLTTGPAGMSLDPASGLLGWTPGVAQPAGVYPATVRVTDEGEPSLSHSISFEVHLSSRVVGRHLFYNQSAWDGNDPAANAADDGAIAPDKQALLPGGTATFSNYSSYRRGINGLMVDIAGLPETPTPADFIFKKGNDATPEDWGPAPAPDTIMVRAGAGVGASARVTLVWGATAVSKQWLALTVLPTASTGLGQADVCYFGNAIGEGGVGNPASSFPVTSVDALKTLNNLSPVAVPIDNANDHNRDGRVTSVDALTSMVNLAVGPGALVVLGTVAPSSAPEDLPPGITAASDQVVGVQLSSSGTFLVTFWSRDPEGVMWWFAPSLEAARWQPVSLNPVPLGAGFFRVVLPAPGRTGFYRAERSDGKEEEDSDMLR